ncbi:hypothetical protein BT63DRAFT_276528 [Microthyrium microscopicum]|uniref:Integral membrane protein n=1 Tax=Microthyrium microscopicum TaxID=703497 RepID=A0A6A6U9Z7_9PEZI|nr:hypothetical protein BT63DRAFT_276528 [Microthyrium microscopicum]
MLVAQNCTNAPAETASDAGVAGAGVLLSFIITAGLAIILSSIIILYEALRKSESRILRKLLQSFSDQQLITGIGIQSVGIAKLDTMVPYHFFIIWMLSLLATATHISTLLALVGDFKRDWVLRWLRQLLMLVNLVLSSVFGVYVLRTNLTSLPGTLPIGCVSVVPSKGAEGNAALSILGTCVVIAGNFILYVFALWYLHSKSQRWLTGLQIIGIVFLLGIATGAAIRIITLSQAFGNASVKLADDGEKDWSFGQLLPLLLLLLPIVSAIEIFRGEMNVPPPICSDGDSMKLGDQELQFQPNPFWGSRSNLVKR